MPSTIIKPERDRDLYVIWSTITECPIAWGDRTEVLEIITEDWRRHRDSDPIANPAGRLDRADIYGTSAADGFAFFGRWDYDGFMYEQRGILPRRYLARACELLEEGREPEVRDLLEPIEEGMEVRRG